MSTAQVIVSLRYGVEGRAAYLLGIRGALIRRIMIDDDRNIVGMGVNTVSTQAADELGDCEYKKTDKGEWEPTWSSRGEEGGENH